MGSTTEWTFIDRRGEETAGDTTPHPRHENVNEDGEKRSTAEGTSEGDAESKQDDGENQEEEEWAGDKIDVFVGSGKVFLQLLGEEDPFGKKGFWSRVMGL
ncbi:hypothetical protein BJ912DRAFT_966728 [Pholiota molesta]|nr:hypothetical protein BJ912DRAFT_966728 [Pholiota molesta]